MLASRNAGQVRLKPIQKLPTLIHQLKLEAIQKTAGKGNLNNVGLAKCWTGSAKANTETANPIHQLKLEAIQKTAGKGNLNNVGLAKCWTGSAKANTETANPYPPAKARGNSKNSRKSFTESLFLTGTLGLAFI